MELRQKAYSMEWDWSANVWAGRRDTIVRRYPDEYTLFTNR